MTVYPRLRSAGATGRNVVKAWLRDTWPVWALAGLLLVLSLLSAGLPANAGAEASIDASATPQAADSRGDTPEWATGS